MVHLILHFLVPALVVACFFRKNWKLAFLLMMASMMVDVDHLLADPIYDPNRCSIGFHPLHELWFIGFYCALCFIPKMPRLRLVGLGLTIHMALDAMDCQVTSGIWFS
ncbi:MAG: DUF6122 family protein [Pseudomonadota bacterium]